MYKINNPERRAVWKNHEIIGYVSVSFEDREFLNGIKGGFYLGFTDEEHNILQNGSENELIQAGFIEV